MTRCRVHPDRLGGGGRCTGSHLLRRVVETADRADPPNLRVETRRLQAWVRSPGTPKPSEGRGREACRRPTRGRATSGDPVLHATRGHGSSRGEAHPGAASPSGDTAAPLPDAPAYFRPAGAPGHVPDPIDS